MPRRTRCRRRGSGSPREDLPAVQARGGAGMVGTDAAPLRDTVPAMRKVRKAVIPAAGLGTRFLPATKAIPKEMLPIVDVPTIQLVIEEAVRAGITDIVVVNGRHKHAIEDHFDHAYELEHTLRERGNAKLADEMAALSTMARLHSVRQKQPLGLGHAVLAAREAVGDEAVAV